MTIDHLRGPVADAAARDLPPCNKCHALRGDPCRTPLDKTRWPHYNRERAARSLAKEGGG